jgi:hypothetical protein
MQPPLLSLRRLWSRERQHRHHCCHKLAPLLPQEGSRTGPLLLLLLLHLAGPGKAGH